MAADPAHEAAEATVGRFMLDAARVYREAEETARANLSRYLESFREKDEAMRRRVADGGMTEDAYQSWRRMLMLTGRRYRTVLDQVAAGYTDANERAMSMLRERLGDVAAENCDWATWQVEDAAKVDTTYALQDASTIDEMIRDAGTYLPRPSVKRAKDEAWNRRKVAAEVTQGVLLGESIPKIAARIRNVTNSTAAAATRAARTSVTAAECAGRVAGYHRAADMGIELEQAWMATLDGRTRHSHRQMDGERVAVGGEFSNGCRYPGDPEAPYAETMNCRCTLVAVVDGIDPMAADRFSRLPEGMSYEEWREGRPARVGAVPANRTIAEFMDMPGTARKLDAAGVGKTEARRLLTGRLREYGIPSGSFRRMSAGDQQSVFDGALGSVMGRKAKKQSTRQGLKPVDENLYHAQKNYAERHGCVVMRGGEDVERRLDRGGVDAAYSMGGRYILFRESPTTSEVLEEVYHFKQDERRDYGDVNGAEMIVRREIDAQNYLLSVTDRYKIPDNEVKQTRANLASYEAELERLLGGEDEGSR